MSIAAAVSGTINLAQAGISIGVVTHTYNLFTKPIKKTKKKAKNILWW